KRCRRSCLIIGEPTAASRASVRRHRRAQGDRCALRSIRPTRARRPFDASVDHIAARSLGKGDEMKGIYLGNLSAELCGWKARPVAPDQRPEASLARGAGNPPCEAETASPKAMLSSVERPLAGASAFVIPGATPRHRNGLVTAVLPASTEHGRTDNGGSPGTCEILSSPQRAPGRETGSTTPGLGGALVRRGAKRTSGRGGTAKRRQRSAAGRAAGGPSALIGPMKVANGPHRSQGREARRQIMGPS